MGWIISALIWAATNQKSLEAIVQGIAALLKAYVALRRSLVDTGALTVEAAQLQDEARDAAIFDALQQDATAAGATLDAQLARLRRRQEPP